jgi:hypothetical protein
VTETVALIEIDKCKLSCWTEHELLWVVRVAGAHNPEGDVDGMGGRPVL